jgi:hypothetical protein
MASPLRSAFIGSNPARKRGRVKAPLQNTLLVCRSSARNVDPQGPRNEKEDWLAASPLGTFSYISVNYALLTARFFAAVTEAG